MNNQEYEQNKEFKSAFPNTFAIGTDIESIERFENKTQDDKFLKKIFTQKEIDYCLSKSKPAQHLCARFCAKEAITKALYSLNITGLGYSEIEILNTPSGIPYAKIEKHPDLNIKISLSHENDKAIAFAIISQN